MNATDWEEWHDTYTREGSELGDRLAAVRDQIRRRLDETTPAPVRVISACAGGGRDLLGVLAERADASRVSALLVEYDPGLAARAEQGAQRLDAQVEVKQGDAALSDVYAEDVPADLVLLCGIFGNISDADVEATIRSTPQRQSPAGWWALRWSSVPYSPLSMAAWSSVSMVLLSIAMDSSDR